MFVKPRLADRSPLSLAARERRGRSFTMIFKYKMFYCQALHKKKEGK